MTSLSRVLKNVVKPLANWIRAFLVSVQLAMEERCETYRLNRFDNLDLFVLGLCGSACDFRIEGGNAGGNGVGVVDEFLPSACQTCRRLRDGMFHAHDLH